MGGGLMQLVLSGKMNDYITLNPSINYYKYMYKKHTNFSMETYRTEPITNANLGFLKATDFEFNIERRADLLTSMFLTFRIPNIYSSNDLQFRWVENLGYNYIERAELKIGGNIIETLYGDWMNIWNELTNKDGIEYNKLIGNIDEYINPYSFQAKYALINNKLYNINYPLRTINDATPSIKEREIQVPLNFWFTRNPSLALPLLKLANQEVKLRIYTNKEGFEGLYKVWSNILNTFISPIFYNELHNPVEKLKITKFVKDVDKNFGLRNTLHLTYVYLDSIERGNMLLNTNTIDYVIDTVKVTDQNVDIVNGNDATKKCTITNANNHIKELIWILRRSDAIRNFNNYTNYTASHVYTENMGIMNDANIEWSNNTSRVEYTANYYNQIQPYNHHTNVPRTGIYCYSFALFPEKIVTSGSYDNSKITTSITMRTNDYSKDETYNYVKNIYMAAKNSPYDVYYETKIFAKELNVLSIINGSAQLKYI